MRHVRQRHDRLIGFTYDEAAGVAHFSMYVPGTAGRVRKRATVRAASYDQAVGLWSAFRSRAAEGLRRPSPEAPTFCEFISDYFPSIEANVKEKTAIDYRYSIDRHLIPQLGALRLTEITSGVLNRLGASLKASGYAGATVNKYMTLAALLLGYAVEFDVIAELPLKKKLKKQQANKPCLELHTEERAAFLAAFNDEPGFRRFLAETMPKGKPRQTKDGRFGSRRAHGAGMRDDSDAAHAYFLRFQTSRDLFVAALETGIRSGDLRALTRRHVDFEEGWIRFIQQKTSKEVVIPISHECRLALQSALGSREVSSADDPVFVTETGLPYGQSTMRRYFKVAKRVAGITRRVRFHDLRHTFGCDLATAGLPLRFIGKVMGHANASTTERYARPDQVVLERVREALNRER